MKRAGLPCLFSCLFTTLLWSQSDPAHLTSQMTSQIASPSDVHAGGTSEANAKVQARLIEQYGKLPLSFEANHGQAESQVKFLARTGGYTLFLTADEAVLALRGRAAGPAPKGAADLDALPVSLKRYPDTNPVGRPSESAAGGVLRMKLRNADPAARVSGVDELTGTSNYFIGNDPAKWHTKVPNYAKVKYKGIYPGIDLVYYGNQRQLEYDFIVAPGADPRRIAFDVEGAKRIRKDAQGDLVLKMETGDGELRWHRPVVYQEKNGARQLVTAHYAITDTNRVTFELAKYDAGRPLYIDPLIYSTYLGSDVNECVCNTFANPVGIAVDNAGNAYVTGQTFAANFPVTPGAFQTTSGGANAFVTKINPTGTALVYSTYLGGSGFDAGYAITVDSSGDAYVTGRASSTNFPVTPGAFQTTCADPVYCWNAFVTEINSSGSALVYSTYLGGSGGDQGLAIAVDSAGSAYVTGTTSSTNFPVTPGAFQTAGTAHSSFVTKFNPAGSALVYSTYLGGADPSTVGNSIAVNSTGNAYVGGSTYSIDFPTTPGAFQTVCVLSNSNNCNWNAFVTEFSPTGAALVYSTYLGGTSDALGQGIALNSAGNVYVTGYGGEDFPVTPGAFQTACCGVFVTEFNPTGTSLVYSTYLGGGTDADGGNAIAVDGAGNAYVTGYAGQHFPTENPVQKKYGGGKSDAFVAKLNPTGSALVYSTYLGGSNDDYGDGIALDSAGNAYVIGWTASTNFPVTPGVFQPTYVSSGGSGALGDAFVAKLNIATTTATALSSAPNPSTYGEAVTFTAVVTSNDGPPPDGETVSFMKGGKTVLGTGTLSGGSASFTTSTLKAGTFSITAVYGGDASFAGSKSKVDVQVVEKAEN